MRGAEMLFAALFAVIFLRRSLNRWHYGGIGCCVLGIALVGVSSMLSGEAGWRGWVGAYSRRAAVGGVEAGLEPRTFCSLRCACACARGR